MHKNFLIIEPEPSGHHFEMYLKAIFEKFSFKQKIILLTSKRALKSPFLKNLKKKNIKIEIYEDINSINFPIKFFQIILNQFLNYYYLKRKYQKLKKIYFFDHIFINTFDDYFLSISILGSPFDKKFSAIFNNPDFFFKDKAIKNIFIYIKIILINLILKQRYLNKIYFNNFLTYKFLQKKIFFKKKIEWFYEPVKFRRKGALLNKEKIILVFGAIKKSKCVKELLDIFKHPKSKEKLKYKVKVIGEQYKDTRDLFNSSYCKKLVKTGKLFVKNKFVNKFEERFFFKNSYLVWVAYEKKFLNSSGVLFTAMKYSKPVIANNHGYLGYLVKKYNLGEICRSHDSGSILKVLKKFDKKNYIKKVSSIHSFKKEYEKNSFYRKITF